MEWNCLIVDLYNELDQDMLEEQLADLEIPLGLQFVTGVEEASVALSTGSIACICIFANKFHDDLQGVIKTFTEKVGCVPDFQLIIVEDPNPDYLISIFEYGVEQLANIEGWASDLKEFCGRVAYVMEDRDSTEYRNVELAYAIRNGDQERILKLSDDLQEIAKTDYRAAFARGRGLEAVGHFSDAIDEYSESKNMNKMFRLAHTNLAQTLMLRGSVDEAILIYEDLERSNPNDLSRKADLAAAYMEKGEWEIARSYLDDGQAISPNHTRIIEAQAQLYLNTGKIGEAFKLLDQLDEIGPFFASKLNELGIKLSQSGKGKSALALYQKAHKIVRPELRYKISLNSALACRRLNAHKMALKYVARCRIEYGSTFEKLDKIEAGLRLEIGKKESAA